MNRPEERGRVLIVDDEVKVVRTLADILKSRKFDVETAPSGKDALRVIQNVGLDAVLLDLVLGKEDGLAILRRAAEIKPGLPVIMLTGHGTIAKAVEAVKLGAFDFLEKPVESDRIILALENALRRTRLERERAVLISDALSRFRMVGASEAMKEIGTLIDRTASSDARVLITGESGTGKELIARAIHYNSARKDRPFVPVDCAVLSENLLESELFGHIKGSFTGAIVTKPGLFEVADGGSLFLDEIGNISLAMQSKLLRVIQEREFTPVGGTKLKKIDIRLIAATNQDLPEKIREGTFREDLFYRLNIVPIHLPPLRERTEDIPFLALHFLKKNCQEMGKNLKALSPAALELLMRYSWPGNVRELENIIERAVIMTDEEVLLPQHFPFPLQESAEGISFNLPRTSEELKELKRHLRDKAVEEAERLFVLGALTRNDWNVTRSAKDVGMLRPNFQALMRKHNIRSQDRED
jgi:DNA-binding NtrC family response regulator